MPQKKRFSGNTPKETRKKGQIVWRLQEKSWSFSRRHKRRVDAGYGSRYGVANSVGSKLMGIYFMKCFYLSLFWDVRVCSRNGQLAGLISCTKERLRQFLYAEHERIWVFCLHSVRAQETRHTSMQITKTWSLGHPSSRCCGDIKLG